MFSLVSSDYITYGLIISVVTAVIINRFNYYFGYFRALYPPNLRQSEDRFRQWKWRNFLISFIHSLITGIGAIFCVLYRPRLLIEVIDEYLEASYLLTSFSHGYFLYDLLEMLTHLQYKGNKELVVHHIMIISCFSLTVFQQKYCGYSSIALIIEFSNIFLHFRQLLLISDTPRSSTIYKTNSYLNIIIFPLVRGLCLIWLWITLFWVLPRVPIIPKIIAFTSLIGICLMTYILFRRIFNSDFSPKKLRDKASINGQNGVNQLSGTQCKDSGQQINGFVSNPKLKVNIHSKSS